MQKKRFTKEELSQLKHLHTLCFNDGDNYINYFLKHRLNKSTCFMKKIEEKIVGVLYSRPMQFKLGKKVVSIPFITGVATHPKHRNTGIAKNLLEECIAYWTRNNSPFVLLYPFNHDFYKKQSFETISFVKSIQISKDMLFFSNNNDSSPGEKENGLKITNESISPNKNVECVAQDTKNDNIFSFREASAKDFKICKKIYNDINKQSPCYQIRDTSYFKDLFLEHFQDSGKGILVLKAREPIGYFLYSKEDIRETIIPKLSSSAFNTIMSHVVPAIYKYVSNFKFEFFEDFVPHSNCYFCSKSFKFEIEEYAMARACNISNLLKNSIYIPTINGDGLFSIGNNEYLVSVKNGECKKLICFDKSAILKNSALNKQIDKALFTIKLESNNQLIKGALGNSRTNSLFESVFSVYNITMYDKY